MIVGVGTDIVQIARISALYQKSGAAFSKRILSSSELTRLEDIARPEAFLAKRWAAKEAVSKALGTGFSQGVSFTDMTIERTEQGQPLVLLSGKAAEVANALGIQSWNISISDEKEFAVAFVVAEKS